MKLKPERSTSKEKLRKCYKNRSLKAKKSKKKPISSIKRKRNRLITSFSA